MEVKGVVHSNGDAAWGSRSLSGDGANVSFKGKMATLVFGHFDPIHPLKCSTGCGQQWTEITLGL